MRKSKNFALILVLVLSMVLTLSACGADAAPPEANLPAAGAAPSTAYAGEAEAETEPEQETEPEPESEPELEPEPEPELETLSDISDIIGIWYWSGSPYYTFEENGLGTMAGLDIHWTIRENILSICNTPSTCGAVCPAPLEWYYEVDGDMLTLTSAQIAGMSFEYTRGTETAPAPEPEVTQEPIAEQEPELEPEPEPEAEAEVETESASIVGRWNFMGLPYYVFEEGGRGTMSGADIRWNIRGNDVLSICTTPDICGARCIAPTEWYYELRGNRLILTSTLIAGFTFEYTRG